MMRKKPELLVPAGDMEKLRMAVLYGADAVYLAGTAFGMRAFAGNFSPEELPEVVRYAHEHGAAVHVTVNTMPRWQEAEKLPEYLERLEENRNSDALPPELPVVRLHHSCAGAETKRGNAPVRRTERYGRFRL